jgi:predicted ATPase
MALVDLVEADTSARRRDALYRLAGRGVRVTEQTRVLLTRQAQQVAPIRSLAPHPAESSAAKRLEPGPAPSLTPERITAVEEWVSCWRHSGVLEADGVRPGALLLYGPPGTGKTMLTRWIAGQLADRMAAFVLDAHDWTRSHLGESGQQLKSVFTSFAATPGLLVLEELDSVGSVRDSGDAAAGETNRITIALMRLIEAAPFPVVATTNRLDALDSALLRRFDSLVELAEPPAEIKLAVIRGILRDTDACVDADQPIVSAVREARRARQRWLLTAQDGGAR